MVATEVARQIENDKIYSIKEAAKVISKTEMTIKNWMKSGRLKYIRISPKCIRIKHVHLMCALNKITTQTTNDRY